MNNNKWTKRETEEGNEVTMKKKMKVVLSIYLKTVAW